MSGQASGQSLGAHEEDADACNAFGAFAAEMQRGAREARSFSFVARGGVVQVGKQYDKHVLASVCYQLKSC